MVHHAVSDLASVITAMAALVAAGGGVLAAVLAYRARGKAEEAKQATDDNREQIIAVGDKVYQLGERLDGPLSELITSIRREGTTAASAADAAGFTRGEQAQRDRSSPPG